MHHLALIRSDPALVVRAFLAFDRETTTIAALWSMIVASVAFLVGVAVIYRRERRGARTGVAGSGLTTETGDGAASANATTVPFAVDDSPPVAVETPAAGEVAPPDSD